MTILNNKIKYFLFFLISISFALAGENCIEGNGKVETFEKNGFSISSFMADGTFDIEIIPSKSYKLKLIAESNILEVIKKDISNDTLKLYPTKSICPEKDIMVKLYVPKLNMAKVSGNIDLAFNLSANSLNLELEGNVNAKGKGEISELSIISDGSAELSMFDLNTKITNLKSEGMLNLEITATKQLNINADGMTEISLKGNAKINKQNSDGMLDIEKY